MNIAQALPDLGLSQAALAKKVGIAKASLRRIIVNGQWPARGAVQARQKLEACLREHGATPNQLLALFVPHKEVGPGEKQLTEAVPP